MPRVVLDPRLALKAIPQPIAASQVGAARVQQAATEEIAAVASGIPSNLDGTLSNIEARLAAIENA